MRSLRFLLLALVAGCSSSTTPVSTPTDLGADANDASDDAKSVDVSTPCMCNCDVGPSSARPRRDDWPSCGIPGSGPLYARCCGI